MDRISLADRGDGTAGTPSLVKEGQDAPLLHPAMGGELRFLGHAPSARKTMPEGFPIHLFLISGIGSISVGCIELRYRLSDLYGPSRTSGIGFP